MALTLENQGEEGTLTLATEPGAPTTERTPEDTKAKAERVKFSLNAKDRTYLDPNTVEAQLLERSENELARTLAESEKVQKM